MKYLITYADNNYKDVQKLCTKSGVKIAGFDKAEEFGPESIEDDFIGRNQEIFRYKRGSGLWIWKPYIILKKLKKVNDGDMIFYADSGMIFIRSMKQIFRTIESKKIWITELPLLENQFTKRETIAYMNADEYSYTNQRSASFIGFIKCDETIKFVNEWLELCCNETLLSPKIFHIPNAEEFIQHREDQSILSLLSKKYNIDAMADISEYGIFPEMYWITDKVVFSPQILLKKKIPYVLHYRRRKELLKSIVKTIFLLIQPRLIARKLIISNKKKYWRSN